MIKLDVNFNFKINDIEFSLKKDEAKNLYAELRDIFEIYGTSYKNYGIPLPPVYPIYDPLDPSYVKVTNLSQSDYKDITK